MNRSYNYQADTDQQNFWQRVDARAGELIAAFIGAYSDPVERGVNDDQPEYAGPKSSMTLVAVPNGGIAFVSQKNETSHRDEKPSRTPDLDQLVCAD